MVLTRPLASGLPWLSIAPVVVLSAVAATVARRPSPATATGRRLRLAGTLTVGLLAIAGTAWQAREISAAREPPAVRSTPRGKPVIPDLQEKIISLQNQVNELEHVTTIRTVALDIAEQLADYLRQFGSRRVVVSCTPNDVEAYNYATELTNVLKSAGWDARGPEVTTIFGNVEAMGINVYDEAAPGSDTARILLAGFAKYSIPFETRVAPSDTPKGAPIELFVGAQPTLRAAARSAPPAP
jgi:hypothetical protein